MLSSLALSDSSIPILQVGLNGLKSMPNIMVSLSNTIKKYARNKSPEPAPTVRVENAGSATTTSIIGINETEEANIVELSIWETIRDHPIIIVCLVYANLGALIYGFDDVSLSLCLIMSPFVETFDTNGVIPASWQSL